VVISVTQERSLASSRKEEMARKMEFLTQEEELIETEIADQKLEETEVREKAAAKAEAAEAEAEAEAAAEAAHEVATAATATANTLNPKP
jgi:hypothetical protein